MFSNGRAVQRIVIAAVLLSGSGSAAVVATVPVLSGVSLAASEQVPSDFLRTTHPSGSAGDATWRVRMQADSDGAEILDGPLQVTPGPEVDPLDGDNPVMVDPDGDDPLDGEVVAIVPPASAADPLDGEVVVVSPTGPDPLDGALVVVQPAEGPDPLDGRVVVVVPVTPVPTMTSVAVAPLAEPLAQATAPEQVVAPALEPELAPAPEPATVDSVRAKDSGRRVVVVNGTLPAPATLAGCGVVVVNGRMTVGGQCVSGPGVIALQPIVPRVGTSSATIVNDTPPVISSRRDGLQVGALPQATLGDSIAFAVQAAIFPEDVVVPDTLLVPGVITVVGNQAREDPIILWRSELEAAAARTGIPAEYLASVIQVASRGNPAAQYSDGVGLMRVPVSVLTERGIPPSQWFDPAINIAIGAELIAAGAGGGDTDAAVEAYLAGGCDADDVCVINSTVDDWVVYYRLRMTGPTIIADDALITDATVAMPPGWPFDDGVDASTLIPDRSPVPIESPSGSPFDRIQPGPALNP